MGDILDMPCKTTVLGEIDWSVMPTAKAFALLRDKIEVQVIDIRAADDIAEGTIPGAIWMPYETWRGPAENPGMPRSSEYFSEVIGNAGLRLDVPTLIVHAEDTPLSTGAGAYVYWVLKSLGAEELAILRGGFDAWEEAVGLVAAEPSTRATYTANLAFSEEWRATDADVLRVASGATPGVLLDARPHHMYNQIDSFGQAIAIPRALSLPAQPLL